MRFNLRMLSKKYRLFTLCIIMVFSISLLACGKKSASSSPSTSQNKSSDVAVAPNVNNGSTAKPNTQETADGKAASDYVNVQTTGAEERKLTKNASLRMETKTFDKTIEIIMDNVKNSGAYIENSSVGGNSYQSGATYQYRTAKYVIRVPKQNFDTFLSASGKAGNLLDTKTITDDITSQYFDTEAHLKALKIQEDRLLELLKKSGELKDILQLESELSNIRYKIENLTGTLKKWDNMVDYSSVTIEINEVQEIQKVKPAPATLWEKIKEGFVNSLDLVVKILKGFVVALTSIIPFLIILVPLFFLIRFVAKNFYKKK